MDFLVGGTGGLFNSTPRLFDISLDAYGSKKKVNNEVKNEINVINKR